METGQSNITPGTFNGTLGGTLLIIIVNIKAEELIKTAVLAAIGAVISFIITLGMQFILYNIKRHRSIKSMRNESKK